MVVVMGDGEVDDIRDEVVKNLLPAAEDAFNVSSDAEDRAIAGIGRGAEQALSLLVDATKEFSNVGSFSGDLEGDLGNGSGKISNGKAKQINDATDLIRLYVGNVTDPSYNATVNLADKLSAAGVEFQSDGSDPETGGTWDTWQKSLHDFAQRVFQDSGDTGPSEGHLPLEPHSLPAAGTTPTPWIDENGVVTFETGTEFAGANNVTVWGNFGPAGSWPRTPMTQQEDGRWRLTMPVEAGSYYYKFVVEGVDHKDQTNPTTRALGAQLEHVPGARRRDAPRRVHHSGRPREPRERRGAELHQHRERQPHSARHTCGRPRTTTPTAPRPTPSSTSSTAADRRGRTGSRSASPPRSWTTTTRRATSCPWWS